MNSWHPSLYGHWYAVAYSKEIGRKPIAVSLLDTHIALARTASGSLMALEDRCPHRHAPLSAGCVAGDRMVCPYHGWSFAADGRLREVPGLPADVEPPNVRVRAFSTREINGIVWLRPGQTGQEEPNVLVQTTAAPGRLLWRTLWPGNVVDSMENFLDPMHTHFIHAGLVRRDARRVPAVASFQATDQGFTVAYRGGPSQSGLLFRLFESERIAERAHFAAPGTARIEYLYANGSRVLIELHFTPRSESETDVFAVLQVEGRWAPAWVVRLLAVPLLKKVNSQDSGVLRLQAENRRRFGHGGNASTQLDVVRSTLERFWSSGQLPPPSMPREVELSL